MQGYRDVPNWYYQRLLSDFQREIARIDKSIFTDTRCPKSEVVQIRDITEKPTQGFLLGTFVSFVPVHTFQPRFVAKDGIIQIIKQPVDCYVIQTKRAIPWLRLKLNGKLRAFSSSSGEGDYAIKRCWFNLAAAAVRVRVTTHPELFPGVKLRTRSSLIKHRNLFARNPNEIEVVREMKESFAFSVEALGNNPATLDVFWTLELVSELLSRGVEEKRALQLLTTDEY